MPDLLLDALPVIDLLELTGNTSAVAQLTERDQSSVSRIYRQASNRLGLQFGKGQNGDYRAGANRPLLQELRRCSQQLRLHQPAMLRWQACRWSPLPADGAALPPPLAHRGIHREHICQQVRDHLLDLAVLPGLELFPETVCPDAPPSEVPLACGGLLALPLLRQPLRIVAPASHPLHAPRPAQSPLHPADLAPWPLLPPDPISDPAPRLQRQLQALGLQLAEADHPHPATAPLQLLPALDLDTHPEAGRLRPLPISCGLYTIDVVVVRSDLRRDAAVMKALEGLVAIHRRRVAQHDDLQLLR